MEYVCSFPRVFHFLKSFSIQISFQLEIKNFKKPIHIPGIVGVDYYDRVVGEVDLNLDVLHVLEII